MAECVLLVHAARQEPLGRVLLEAAACGLAVVATDVGGTREIFPRNLNCAAIVPPNDSLVVADAVIRLLRDDPLRRMLANAARRRVEQAFDIRHAADRLVDQYVEVLS
jgi:glycosyltransferase involved in cell wall biosynthesis